MSLWVDKHQPKSLQKLDYHERQAQHLKHLVYIHTRLLFVYYSKDKIALTLYIDTLKLLTGWSRRFSTSSCLRPVWCWKEDSSFVSPPRALWGRCRTAQNWKNGISGIAHATIKNAFVLLWKLLNSQSYSMICNMVVTRFSDENIAFEQQQKSRYLVSDESSDRQILFSILVQVYLKLFTLNLIEIKVVSV